MLQDLFVGEVGGELMFTERDIFIQKILLVVVEVVGELL